MSERTSDDPEYYAELLHKSSKPANRRQQANQQLCGNIPGIQNVDDELSKRLRTLLDVIADMSIRERGNVSATMASVIREGGVLKTQLYIVFNHQNDDAARTCGNHLETVFQMLRNVPYTPTAHGSPKIMSDPLKEDFIEICAVIHTYSFNIFKSCVNKHKDNLSKIQNHIEHDEEFFKPGQRSTLLDFLDHVAIIMEAVTDAEDTKQFPTSTMKLLQTVYSEWTKYNLLPKDDLAGDTLTLLDIADNWLVENHEIGFQLRRWVVKIMSFLISANRLFTLTQSSRLRELLNGDFRVTVLPSPTTTPYSCTVTLETIQVALNAALAEATNVPEDWDDEHLEFMRRLEGEGPPVVKHKRPTVHAELAMIMAMDKGEIGQVFPFVGVSKPSCIMCIHYIDAFNEATNQRITTKGSHGKAYPGWFWPELPNRDRELRLAFIKRMRRQLLEDFKVHARRLSDSNVGSGGSVWKREEAEVKALKLRVAEWRRTTLGRNRTYSLHTVHSYDSFVPVPGLTHMIPNMNGFDPILI